MPNWELWNKRNEEGTLDSGSKILFEEATRRGMVPGTKAYSTDNFTRERRMLSIDANTVSDEYANGIMGSYLKKQGLPINGVTRFTSNPAGMSGRDMIKRLQMDMGASSYEDVMDGYDEWKVMTPEERRENVSIFSAERIAAELHNVATIGISDEATREARRVEGEGTRRFNKGFTRVRQQFESRVQSKIGRDYSKYIAEGGEWDQNLFLTIPQAEREHIPGYIQAIKPRTEDGVITEAIARFETGVKDVTAGSLKYVGEQGVKGWYAGMDLIGDRKAASRLQFFREELKHNRDEVSALEEKYEERGVMGKGFVGVAGSLPLMASFYITGPAALSSAAGKAGVLAKTWTTLMTRMPVAMATLSLARTHEAMLIDRGVAPEFAPSIALGTSIINMYVEKAALDQVFGVGKERIFSIASNHIMKNLAKGSGNALFRAVKVGGVEGAEELIQGLNEELTAQLGSGNIDSDKLFKTAGKIAAEVGPTLMYFAAAGVGGGIATDATISDRQVGIKDSEIASKMLNDTLFGKFDEIDGLEDFNRVHADWSKLSTPEAQAKYLDSINIVDVKGATVELERWTRIKEEVATRENGVEKIVSAVKALGGDTKFVEQLSDSLDPEHVGQYSDGVLEIIDGAKNPDRVVRHEAFHFLRDIGVINDEQWSILKKSASKKEYKDLALRYKNMVGDAKAEDIMADAWGVFDAQERSVWKKVIDWVRQFVGLKNEKDVFREIESYLQDVRQTASTGSVQTPSRTQPIRSVQADNYVRTVIDKVARTVDPDAISEQEFMDRIDAEIAAIEEFSEELDRQSEQPVVTATLKSMEAVDKAEKELIAEVEKLESLEKEEQSRIDDFNKQAQSVSNEAAKAEASRKHAEAEKRHKPIEKKLNEASVKAKQIDKLVDVFDKKVASMKAVNDTFFMKLNAGMFHTMANAIKNNDPAKVKSTSIKIVEKMRAWDKFTDSQKLKVLGKAEAKGTQFARGERIIPKNIADAAEVYAVAKTMGRNIDSTVAKLVEQTELDEKDIRTAGERYYKAATSNVSEKATALEKRIAVKSANAARSINKTVRDAEKTGIKRGEKAALVKQSLRIKNAEQKKSTKEREAKSEERAQLKKAHIVPQKYIDNVISGEDVQQALDAGNIQALGKAVQLAADAYTEDNGITDKKAKAEVYKHTLYHILWSGPVSKLKYDRSKAVIKKIIDKIIASSTTVATANKLAKRAMAKLVEVKRLSKLKELRSDFEAIISTKANKRVKSSTLLKDRTIKAEKAAELSIIKSLWRKGDKVLKPMLSKIEHAINYKPDTGQENIKSTEEFQQEAIDTLAKKIPGLNDESISRAIDPQLQLIMLHGLINDYGGLYHRGNTAISEAFIALEAEIDGAAKSMADIARKQTETIKLNRERAMEATKPVRKGVKSAFSGGAIWGSIQSRLRDMTRVGSGAAKSAMEALIKDLNFQKASREYDTMKREFAKQWQEQLVEAYGLGKGVEAFAKAQKKIIDLNDPKKKWSKYSQDGSDISTAQVMQIVATYWQGIYIKQLENVGITESMVEEMEESLAPKDIAFLNNMVELYSEWGVKLDDKSMSIYGTPLSNQSWRYLPVVTDVVKPYNATDVRSIPLLPPSFNKRQPGKKTRIDTSVGFFEVLDGKLNENAHWLSHVDSSLLARSVFNGTSLTRQMADTYGKEAVKLLHEHLDDVYSNNAVESVRDPLIRRLSSIVSMRYLSGSLKQIFTQPTSFPAFAHKYGLLKGTAMFAKGVANPQTYMDNFSKLWKSDQMKSRLSLGQTEYIESALKQRFGDSWVDKIHLPENARIASKVLTTAIKQMYKMGMVTNTIGDIIPIMTVGPTIYMEELRLADGNEELAMDNTWDAIESSQQSHAVKDRSRLSRRGGLAVQLIGQFINTPGQYAAFEVAAFKQLVDEVRVNGIEGALKKEGVKKLLNAVAINHIILPGMFYAVSTMFNNFLDSDDWDEDDTVGLAVQMISGPASAHMVGMALTESFLHAAITGKGRWGGGMIPLDSFVKDAKMMGILARHIATLNVDKAFEDAVDLIPEFVAPVRQVKRAVKNR